MNAYRSEASAHRPVFVLAAVVLTAVSLALAVVIPAEHEPASAPAAVASKAITPEPVQVTISPERIEVVGRRTQETALEQVREAASGRKS